MAKAWIRDRWLKSKAVVDGVELTPTTGMKRQVAANPDTADVPAALRTDRRVGLLCARYV